MRNRKGLIVGFVLMGCSVVAGGCLDAIGEGVSAGLSDGLAEVVAEAVIDAVAIIRSGGE